MEVKQLIVKFVPTGLGYLLATRVDWLGMERPSIEYRKGQMPYYKEGSGMGLTDENWKEFCVAYQIEFGELP